MHASRLSRFFPSHRLILATVVLVPLASCLRVGAGESNLSRFGAVSITASTGGPGVARADGSAIFFEAFTASIPDSRFPSNACRVSVVDTTTRTSRGDVKAGAQLALSYGVGANTTSSTLPFDEAQMRYSAPGLINYSAGDSVMVSVPGDASGFPASNIKLLLAEPLVPQDIVVPTTGAPMEVRWNASANPTGAFIIAIRYANPATSTYANEQLVCSVTDTGSADISSNILEPFLNSPVALRSVEITRWRTQSVQVNDKALLHIVSSVDTTVVLK